MSLLSVLASLFLFFFFQAEDGIRDGHVTGVQTCALPIWTSPAPSPGAPGSVAASPRRQGPAATAGRDRRPPPGRGGSGRSPPMCHPGARSEERRVGKEWRAGRTKTP